jgi:hypothetical protein
MSTGLLISSVPFVRTTPTERLLWNFETARRFGDPTYEPRNEALKMSVRGASNGGR